MHKLLQNFPEEPTEHKGGVTYLIVSFSTDWVPVNDFNLNKSTKQKQPQQAEWKKLLLEF